MSPFPPDVRLVIFDADDTLRRTLVPGQPCPHRDGEWEPIGGLREALEGLPWGRGLRMALASNQDHVFYGHLSAATARRLLLDAAEAATGHRPPPWAALFCPHRMEGGCGCRKPEPGLLLRAMRLWGAGPAETLFVGDAPSDREAAARAGVRFLHVGALRPPAAASARP